jgi:hypothetical protein
MASELSKLNFADDLVDARSAPDSARWVLDHRGDLEVWATVSPDGYESEKYIARLFWVEYPGTDAPSVKFVDLATERLNVRTAWPQATSFRPQTFDICANWTAEGFGLHPEWRHDARLRWQADGNLLLKTLRTLLHQLDVGYQGRYKE